MADRAIKKISQIENMQDLADYVGVALNLLTFFAYANRNFYYSFSIPKKNGAARLIDAPNKPLKAIQRKLARGFAEVYKPVSSVFGFVEDRSIATNAACHVNKSFVVKVDLKDFFPSITAGRIRGLLKCKLFDLPDDVVSTITNLVCHNGHLPQGAPTSPVLSNLICYSLDKVLMRYASKNKLKYTRYADDLTFSSTSRKSLQSVAEYSRNGDIQINPEVIKLIEGNGFSINHDKTGIFNSGARQVVTGVVVNKKCNFKRGDYRYLRSLFHYWKKAKRKDAERAEERAAEYYVSDKTRSKYECRFVDANGEYLKGSLCNHIQGLLAYYTMIEKASGTKSDPLLKLWTTFYDLTGLDVPEMIPERSILQTDLGYSDGTLEECGPGTAFILKQHGLLTAKHCIKKIFGSEPAYEDYCLDFRNLEMGICKGFNSFSSFDIKPPGDFAVLREGSGELDVFSALPGLSPAKKCSFQKGQKVFAYGYAKGEPKCVCKEAHISYVNGNEITVDEAFICGMSGGPVLNAQGEVIGLITRGSEAETYDRNGVFLAIDYVLNPYGRNKG